MKNLSLTLLLTVICGCAFGVGLDTKMLSTNDFVVTPNSTNPKTVKLPPNVARTNDLAALPKNPGVLHTDGTGTNVDATFNGTTLGLTNLYTYTAQTETNMTLVFDGRTKVVTVTNFPNLILTGGTNGIYGDYVFHITRSNNIYGLFNTGYIWLTGSNANPCIVTNGGILGVTKIGSTTFVSLLQEPYTQ